MTFTFNMTDNSFTLTCISTGGPPTTVSWTRDTTTVITEGTETVLNNGVTEQFTHTLLVTDRTAGLYKCAIANDVSHDSAELTIEGETADYYWKRITMYTTIGPSLPSNVRVTQNGLESLLVTWTPSQGPDVTGYTIFYQQRNGKNSGLLTVERTDTSAIITGLTAEATFSISVSATSDTLPSTTTQGKEILIGMYVLPILQDESLIIIIMWSLYTEPANISLTSSPPSPIMSGATVILTCSISLPIAIPDTSGIQWEGPPGVTPSPVNSINSEGKIISVLTLSQIETLQSGLYKCNFSFSGSVSASMTIEILGRYL